MRTITTAAAFTIAASLAAGDDDHIGGKFGKSSKSGDCFECSTDKLIRAQTLTSLTFKTWANDDGDLTYQSVVDFCCNNDEADIFLEAVEVTSGCLVYTNCFLAAMYTDLTVAGSPSDATTTEGVFLTEAINKLCEAEQTGVKQGSEDCPTRDELCSTLLLGSCD